MRVLSFDLSTSAGFACLEGEIGGPLPTILGVGVVANSKIIQEYGEYPYNYLAAAQDISSRLLEKVAEYKPDVVVVEDSQLGKNRYSQKILEFVHCTLLIGLRLNFDGPVKYYPPSAWRSALKISMSKDDRKNNSKISKAKKLVAAEGISIHEAKKRLGVKGKVGKKHLSVRYINNLYNLGFKVSTDDDKADAVALSLGFFHGAVPSDGIL